MTCFDTAFHADLPAAARTFALPREWRERHDLRRYGFHGLSYAWSTRRAAELLGAPDRRLVIAHLGSGASLAAVRAGRPVDTTMGLTPLDGLVMATRSGAVDPGLVLWLVEHGGLSAHEVAEGIDRRGGLLGLAGTKDMREVLARSAAGDDDAVLAVEVYLHRLAASVAAMTAALGGLDALVVTGGVGEASADVRRLLVERLGFLGLALDPGANDGFDPAAGIDADLSAAGAAARVLVVRCPRGRRDRPRHPVSPGLTGPRPRPADGAVSAGRAARSRSAAPSAPGRRPVSGERSSHRTSGSSTGWFMNDADTPARVSTSRARSRAIPARTQSARWSCIVESTAMVGVVSNGTRSRSGSGPGRQVAVGSPDADGSRSERAGGDALPLTLAAHPVGPLARGGRQGQGGVELGGADQPDDAVDLRGVVVDPQHGVLEVDGLDHLGQHRLGHPAVRERVPVGPARRDRRVEVRQAARPRGCRWSTSRVATSVGSSAPGGSAPAGGSRGARPRPSGSSPRPRS